MERKITIGAGMLEVFYNDIGSITIKDDEGSFVSFDECCAEKICKFIMEVAQEIRSEQNE